MRRLTLLFTIVIALLAGAIAPTHAQDNTTHPISVDGFALRYPASLGTDVHIRHVAGAAESEGPMPPNAPYTEILIYNAVEGAARPGLLDAPATIRLYPVAAAADYDYTQQQVQALQTLLASRPDLNTYMQPETVAQGPTLPFLPVVNAAQVLRARAQYVDLAGVSGVSYVTTFAQAVVPFTAQGFFTTFQGLTANGDFYVSAVLPVTNTLFPPDIPQDFDFDAFMATLDSYNAESLATLNSAAPDAFNPTLNTLDALIASFSYAPVS